MTQPLPLDGVRVLAISQFGAGPFATLNLADMGAEVIKIEDPETGGEVSRFVPPYRVDGDSLYFQCWNRNKRSVTLNLRKPGGMQLFRELVRVSDIVFNNLRGDQPAKLALTYATLGEVNRRIVCCSLNGLGSTGPHASDPGYDYLMQARMGYMSMTGDPDGPLAACGVSFIDHAAGFAAALGMVAALFAARQSGTGRDVEVSLLDTAASMLTYLAAWNLNRGFEPKRYRGSAHQTLVPVQTFRTADGYITLFCGKEKFWKRLCEVLGEPELASDPRCASFEARFKNRDFVVDAIQKRLMEKTTSEWMSSLEGSVPCAPVHTMPQALADPLVRERGAIVEVEHPQFGTVRQVNTPVRFGEPRRDHRRAPALGEDTEAVLKQYLNYDDQRIENLRKTGLI